MSYFQFIVSWVNGEIVMLHAEKESGAEVLPFQPNMVAMSVLMTALNPATSHPALVSYKIIIWIQTLELPQYCDSLTTI